MIKHGASHAGASLVCVLTASLLGRLVGEYVPALKKAVEVWVLPVFTRMGIHVGAPAILQLFPILVIGFVWGVAFKLARQR